MWTRRYLAKAATRSPSIKIGAVFITGQMSALGCDFNRSTQHLISKYREEDVAYEAATEESPKWRLEALVLKHKNRICMAIKFSWSTLSVKKEMVEQTIPLVGVGIEGHSFRRQRQHRHHG